MPQERKGSFVPDGICISVIAGSSIYSLPTNLLSVFVVGDCGITFLLRSYHLVWCNHCNPLLLFVLQSTPNNTSLKLYLFPLMTDTVEPLHKNSLF